MRITKKRLLKIGFTIYNIDEVIAKLVLKTFNNQQIILMVIFKGETIDLVQRDTETDVENHIWEIENDFTMERLNQFYNSLTGQNFIYK